MKSKTKTKILSALLSILYAPSLSMSYATDKSLNLTDEPIAVVIPEFHTEHLALDLDNAISRLGYTGDRTQLDGIIENIRNGNYRFTRTSIISLLASVIILSERYSDAITMHGIINPGFVDARNMELFNICNEFLQFFLELGNTDRYINQHNETGDTLLHIAVMRHNSTAVRILLEHGVDAGLPNAFGRTPYALAEFRAAHSPIYANEYGNILTIFRENGITQ